MKKLLLLFCMLMGFSALYAGELQKILSTDKETATPVGCTKVVFVKGSGCAAIPSMVIVDKNNVEYTLEANSSSSVPYMYFIPNGSYKILKMNNIKSCCSALGDLVVGSSFEVPAVGYFTIDSKYDAPVTVTHPSYGPYLMHYDMQKPEGYSKVVVDSSEKYINGSITIKSLVTGETYIINGSATYERTWYYYIPMDEYQVISISANYKTRINGFDAYNGYKFKFVEGGSVFFNELQ